MMRDVQSKWNMILREARIKRDDEGKDKMKRKFTTRTNTIICSNRKPKATHQVGKVSRPVGPWALLYPRPSILTLQYNIGRPTRNASPILNPNGAYRTSRNSVRKPRERTESTTLAFGAPKRSNRKTNMRWTRGDVVNVEPKTQRPPSGRRKP